MRRLTAATGGVTAGPLVVLFSPAAVRAQAYAWAILWLGVGALIAPLLAGIGESSGYRVALGVPAVTLLAGGAAATTARGSVRADAERARNDLTGRAPLPVP